VIGCLITSYIILMSMFFILLNLEDIIF